MDSTQTDLKHKHIKDESLLEVLVFIKHFAELSHRSSLSLSIPCLLWNRTQNINLNIPILHSTGILKGSPDVSLDISYFQIN